LGDKEKAIADYQKVLETSQDSNLRQEAQQRLDELGNK
jgi:predicted negative regulator of RcsB-dependent stress response